MPGKRIKDLTALSGAGSANDDDVVIFDTTADTTKRISRSQLAEGMQSDVQVLTNKTLALGSNTVTGTTAQFNTALTDGDFTTLAGSGVLTNKTIDSATNTLTVNYKEAQVETSNGSRTHLFTTVAALLADTGTYTTYAAGQIVEAGGFRYTVAATGATDHHVITAGGVKLYVQVGDDGAYNVMSFGARGDGVTDDTAAIRAALTLANSKRVTGLVATILHPGTTLVIPPLTYAITSIAATLPVNCNLDASGARFVVPAAYAGEVMRVGDDRATYNLAGATINLPDVYKPTGSAIVGGSVGVRTANCNKCRITYGRVSYFDNNLHFGGIGEGTVYCDLYVGQLNYGNHLIHIVPGSGGWFNANTIYGGNMRLAGARVTGQAHVYIDGLSPATAVVGNIFIAPAYEGDGAEYIIDAKGAYGNVWKSLYYETGAASRAVTVSGDTLTRVAHGFVVGDMLMFAASVLPTGMFDVTPYWVTAVPTADTFKVSQSRGGTAVTFSTAGTAVVAYLQGRCRFDGTTSLCYNNRIETRFSPPSVLLDYINISLAVNNGEDSFEYIARSINSLTDYPIFRGRQRRATTATRAVFGAYPAAIDPEAQPNLWTVGLSDRGVMFNSAAGVEIGRITSTSGTLQYEAADNGVTAEIPSGFRSASLTTLGTTSVAAGARNIQTLTVTGAAVGDYVVPHTYNALPDGIVISWARVSTVNTVQICFNNISAGAIDLVGAQLKALVYRSTF